LHAWQRRTTPIARGFWKWASPPLVLNGAATVPVDDDNVELIWYNPFNTVKAGDLNPRLTRNEGKENIISVLGFYFPKEPVQRTKSSMWAGVTSTVEADGTDFSRLQYLEIWLNDWRDPDVRMTPGLKLHIDLGLISEDEQRAPNVPPNGQFDTEDKNKDGKYDPYPPGEDLEVREDGGGDGVPDELEGAPGDSLYDLSTVTPQDPHGDDYGTAVNEQGEPVKVGEDADGLQRYDPYIYIRPTLSEKSKLTVENGTRLFTEDLDNNQLLDVANSYVSYVLPIGDQVALQRFIISSAEDTPTIDGTPVPPNNGWRRFRIPLDEVDPAYRQVIGGGSLSNVFTFCAMRTCRG